DVTADIVSVVERSAPSATTTSTPGATSTPTATPAIAASAAATPAVLPGPNVVAATAAFPTAAGAVQGAALTSPTGAAGVVLASSLSGALGLPRTGGDPLPGGDARFAVPNPGVSVDGSAMPGRAAPLPTTGGGAGVVTEELPDPPLPAIELVPPDTVAP